jgi:predicted Zn finger-like uncharacterized protein
MKISCQSCQAKYTIADEKVLGKIVKIRCKKCSATIVINGNEQAAPAAGADTNAYDYTAQPGAEPWTVNVTDGDQRTMTVQEIVQEYRAGVVNDETYCWKDGMSDWLPLREIEELYAAAAGGGGDEPPMSAGPAEVVAAGGLFGHGDADAQPVSMHPETNGNGSGAGSLFGSSPPPAGASAAASTSAARRVGGRGGGDLFGAVATAGGEEDVMTSAPVGPPPVSDEPPKLTGQRNENSVLFSLAALTTNEEKKKQDSSAAANDGSGLIDIRALSKSMTSGDKKDDKGQHVDDIMNLGGGGAFGAALAAPILAPPPIDNALLEAAASGAPSGGRQKNVMLLAGIGVVFVAMLFTIIFLATRKPDEPVAQPTSLPSAPPVPTDTGPAATATQAPLAMNDTPKPDKDKGGTAAPPKVGGGGGKSGGGGGGHAPAAAGGGGGGGGGGGADPTPATGGGGGGGSKSLGDAIRDSASGGPAAPAAQPAAASAPFDRGAAAAALGNVNVSSCKKPDGPTGSGHVSVTFQPDGSVQSAVVDQPPFAGTPVGGCVAGKFRGARVPAFSGGNVKVGKSFTVN